MNDTVYVLQAYEKDLRDAFIEDLKRLREENVKKEARLSEVIVFSLFLIKNEIGRREVQETQLDWRNRRRIGTYRNLNVDVGAIASGIDRVF